MSVKAISWAFELPLEPRAKFTVVAIADNARDDGVAWPSLGTIADKSSQSRDTVRRRMKKLEKLGVLQCFARFREDGTQTTDEIRLNLAMTPAELKARLSSERVEDADHDDDDGSDGGEGGGVQAATLGSQSCDPTVAVVQGGGLQSCTPIEPSLEPEDSPQAPQVGGSASASADQDEPEHFAEFWASYPDHEVMRKPMALDKFRAMTPAERLHARAAVLLLAEQLKRMKRKPLNAHLWLASKGWEEYPNAKLPEKPQQRIFIPNSELKPLHQAFAIIGRELSLSSHENQLGIWRYGPLPADLRALDGLDVGDRGDWHDVEEGSRQFASWRDRLRAWTSFEPDKVKIWEEPFDERVHGGTFRTNPNWRMPRKRYGLRVPWLWPPRKDGTLSRPEDEAMEGDER